jgi:glycosyltransferase involved in cell wall biosynthesis
MPQLLAASDCLLLTSAIEGSPNVVKEAVSCGLPVVSTPVGDVEEILGEVEPSWICPAEPQVLGSALAECLAQRARSDGWDKASWLGQEPIAARLLELYRTKAPALDAVTRDVRCAA